MSEQWFLDLDGVRSGPYQTSEVMSLVAEGEILPHHLISTELKSQKWMTILEWRLNQNKNPEPKKEIHSTLVAPENPAPAARIIEPEPPKPAPAPVAAPSPAPAPTPATPSVPVHHAAEPIKAPLHAEVKHSPPPHAAATANPAKAKRDPMAEMFDMLQNTKQKREVKSQHEAQAHAQAHSTTAYAPPAPKTSGSGTWVKTILVAVVITILGFALGQLFQKKAAEQPVANNSAPTSTPAPKPSAEQPTEVVDRSNEKMTIRAQVPAGHTAENHHESHPSANATPAPEHTKDIQELKDLKKELMELKALKDEIRNNNGNEMRNNNSGNPSDQPENPDNMDGPVDENGNPINPNTDMHY